MGKLECMDTKYTPWVIAEWKMNVRNVYKADVGVSRGYTDHHQGQGHP